MARTRNPRNLILSAAVLGSLSFVVNCLPIDTTKAAVGTCTTPGCVEAAAFILNLVDFSADPCQDFYQFACGKYVANTNPPDGSFSGPSDDYVKGLVTKTTMEMLTADINHVTSPAQHKAIEFFDTCILAQVNDETSTTFLRGFVKEVGGFYLSKAVELPANWTLEHVLARTIFPSGNAMLGMLIETDSRNTTRNGLILSGQTTPVFNHSEYALKLDADPSYLKEAKAEYVKYLKDLMKKMLLPKDYKDMREIYLTQLVDFEFQLAKATPPPEDPKFGADVEANNHTETDEDKYSQPVSVLQALSPNINWTNFFSALGKKYKVNALLDADNLRISIRGATYLKSLSNVINATLSNPVATGGKRTIQNYIALANIMNYIDSLSCSYSNRLDAIRKVTQLNDDQSDAESANASDDQETCEDSEQKDPTECFETTKQFFMQLLSRQFVTTYFPDSYRDYLTNMTGMVRNAYIDELGQLSWMDAVTRANALTKINKMEFSIGYPPNLFDASFEKQYEKLMLFSGDYLTSLESLTHYNGANNLRTLDNPANKISCSWQDSDPTEQNAFYTPTCNAFSFQAGFGVSPFFQPDYPAAFAWGKIAQTIGHEMTHGFDNRGKNYNEDGLFANWWTDASLNEFEKRTQCLVDQFNSLANSSDGTYGDQVLGENIADNGGLKISYQAFRKAFPADFFKRVEMPGLPFTNDQVFFLANAQVDCQAYDADGKDLLLNDVHALGSYSVNAMTMNLKAAGDAFNCPIGSPMSPNNEARCDVW